MHLDNLSICLIFTFIIYSTVTVESYKLLGILPTTFRSHFIFGASLLRALARKGHEVYVISPFPSEKPIPNYHDVPFKYDQSALQDPSENAKNMFELSADYQEYMMAQAIFESPHVRQLMNSNQTFDAVLCEVFYSEALFGFSEHFKAPLIGLSSFNYAPWTTDMIGSPSPPSYVPSIFSEYSDHMSFMERFKNIFKVLTENLNLMIFKLPHQNSLYWKFFPHLKRNMYTVRQNAAAVLVNTHVSLSYPRPYMPNHVAVGGLHIKRRIKPLPEDIEQFISNAEHGVVYFSMGTNIKSKLYLSSRYESILQGFKTIPQRVLWKLDDSRFIGRHDNVMIRSWFPQQDILAHENVVAFVTQGGILSTTESIYHGTPIIGIPVLRDQFANMAKIAAAGAGISLSHSYVTADDIMGALELLSYDKSYTRRVKQLSARYRDQPMLPLDLAIYWVERVVRQKGAKHLRCAGLDLYFFQYHNLEAALVMISGITGFAIMCLYSIISGFVWLYRKAYPKKTQKPIRKKKKRN